MGIQDIGSPRRSIGPQEVRNAEPLDTSMNGTSSKHRDPAPTWSKLISSKFSNKSISDVYLHCQTNLVRDTFLRKIPNFMDLGMLLVHTKDELGSIFIPTTIIGFPTHGSNWIPHGRHISETTADTVSGKRLENNYNFKSNVENRKEEMVDQILGAKMIL